MSNPQQCTSCFEGKILREYKCKDILKLNYTAFKLEPSDSKIKVLYEHGVHEDFKDLSKNFFSLETQNAGEAQLNEHKVVGFKFDETLSALVFDIEFKSGLKDAIILIGMYNASYLN